MPGQQTDINVTVTAWADIVIKIWRSKIVEANIYDKGELYNSLKYEFARNAGGDIEKIEFVYNFYGMFHDRGTKFLPQREWKSKPFYGQVMKLKEILTQKYIEQVQNGVTVAMMPDGTVL